MLTIHAIKNSERAAHYFSAQDDYYSKEGNGYWLGNSAKNLKLIGEVESFQFRDLLEGKLPDGKRILSTIEIGKGIKRHGWDFTFSAPKSVSMQALIGGDAKVTEAHRQAVIETFKLMEEHVMARRRADGKYYREHTHNLVAAAFDHELSRAKDPQLHTHVIIMNITRRSDGQWRSLSNEELFKHRMLFDAAYRANLARELQKLGYELRLTDKAGGFELAHVSRMQIEAFSQRSLIIEEALRQRGLNRLSASLVEKETIALITRPRKEALTVEEKGFLMENWKSRSIAAGLQFDIQKMTKPLNERASHEALDFAIKHLTERQSVMLESVLVTIAVQHAVGRATYEEIKTALREKIIAGNLVSEELRYRKAADPQAKGLTRHELEIEAEGYRKNQHDSALYVAEAIRKGSLIKEEGRYTTVVAQTREENILQIEKKGRNTLPPILERDIQAIALVASKSLNDEQRHAAQMILTSKNQVIGIQGSAGVGKSHLLKTTKEIAEHVGYKAVAIAPYANQVKRLQEDGLSAATLATFLAGKEKPIDSKTLLLIDEAGLIPSRQMETVLERVERYGARAVLIGDVHQLKAVEAGRPLAQLQENGMQIAVLGNIQRQKDPSLKSAVALASQGKAAASLEHIRRQVLEMPKASARYREIASFYASLSREDRAQTLIVTGTNEARHELNERIRQQIGIAGRGVQLDTLGRRDLTNAERAYAKSYSINDFIHPEKDYPHSRLERGHLYRVAEIDYGNHLILENDKGEQLTINPKMHAHLSIYDKRRTELAKDDWVRITRNDPALDISNGERAVVKELTAKNVVLENEKGRQIALDRSKPLFVEHAYATTVHGAQGLGVDRVIVDLDTRSLTTGKDLYYVAISRARREANIYTNSRSELPAAINRENVKTAALDIRKPPARLERGITLS